MCDEARNFFHSYPNGYYEQDDGAAIVSLSADAIAGAYRAGYEAGQAERDRLREALESHVRGLDAMRRVIGEARGASGKLDDIRAAIIYERVNAVAALQEAGDE